MIESNHPSEESLILSIRGEVDADTEESITQHIGRCQQCQQRIETMAADVESRDQICGALRRELESCKSSGNGMSHTGEVEERLDTQKSVADFAVAFLEPTDRPDAIGRLGEYEVFSVVGQGGMGIVLKGFQEELKRPVAIKVMAPHLATVAAARKRFLREAQATAAIVHPNVMPILSVSESSSLPFLVMPYVSCHSLQQRIDADGPLPIPDILRIAIQVAAALGAAHKQGLVHRDVKPANILLERGIDRAMLTDFGLARAVDDGTVTRSGVIAGTPQYMSPEQARGESIAAGSDLFSLGSVIYAMGTGRPPFCAESSYGILRKITDQQHRPMRVSHETIPVWLDRLVDQLLRKKAIDRYEDAQCVQRILEACLTHVQQPSMPLPVELVPKLSRSAAIRWLALPTVLAVVIGTILMRTDSSMVDSKTKRATQASPPSSTTQSEDQTSLLSTAAIWKDPTEKQIRELKLDIESLAERIDSTGD